LLSKLGNVKFQIHDFSTEVCTNPASGNLKRNYEQTKGDTDRRGSVREQAG